jgi:putative flippase GtrA
LFKRVYCRLPKNLQDFIKFLIVGGLATAVDYATFNFCALYAFSGIIQNDDARLVVSNILAFTLGLSVNFALSRSIFFKGYSNKSKNVEFIMFTIIGVIGLFINTAFVWLLYNRFNIFEPVAKFFATVISFVWNFLARKIFIYNNTEEER